MDSQHQKETTLGRSYDPKGMREERTASETDMGGNFDVGKSIAEVYEGKKWVGT